MCPLRIIQKEKVVITSQTSHFLRSIRCPVDIPWNKTNYLGLCYSVYSALNKIYGCNPCNRKQDYQAVVWAWFFCFVYLFICVHIIQYMYLLAQGIFFSSSSSRCSFWTLSFVHFILLCVHWQFCLNALKRYQTVFLSSTVARLAKTHSIASY